MPRTPPDLGTADESGMETDPVGIVRGRKPPEQLTLFDPDDLDIVSRSERIAQECIDSREPFFVLRAKDIFAVMAVHNYAKLVEEYGPLDTEFSMSVMDSAEEMRKWQVANPERIKYPD